MKSFEQLSSHESAPSEAEQQDLGKAAVKIKTVEDITKQIAAKKASSTENVREVFEARDLREQSSDAKSQLLRDKAKLSKMPLITAPWSETGKEKHKTRQEIAKNKKFIKANRARLNAIDAHARTTERSFQEDEDIRQIDSLLRQKRELEHNNPDQKSA